MHEHLKFFLQLFFSVSTVHGLAGDKDGKLHDDFCSVENSRHPSRDDLDGEGLSMKSANMFKREKERIQINSGNRWKEGGVSRDGFSFYGGVCGKKTYTYFAGRRSIAEIM